MTSQEHRIAWFAGKPGSYGEPGTAVYQIHRIAWFAGKSDRRTAGSYKTT